MDQKSLLEVAFGHAGAISILWEKRSNYAIVYGVQNGAGPSVVKLPIPWVLEGRPLQERLSFTQSLNERTEAFRRGLLARGVPLPEVYDILDSKGYPVHRISYEGVDCATAVRADSSQLPVLLRSIIGAIRGILYDGTQMIGVDTRLSNFATNGNGRAVYIDIFPPLICHEGKYYVHYPNPTDPAIVQEEIVRKFTPFGILRRLRVDLLTMNRAWESAFFEALEGVGEPLYGNMRRAFAALPDARLADLSEGEQRAFMHNIPPTEVDTMREVAAKLIPLEGEERERILDEVFVTSSLAITKDPAEHAERLARYRAIVESFL